MSRVIAAFVAFVLVIAASSHAVAADFGTREEAVAMVKRVQERFEKQGADATFAAVTAQEQDFKDRDLYPFIYDVKGLNVAHGANRKMVGKLWISTKDQDGNFLIREMLKVVEGPGTGWVNYKWPNPLTHKIQDKSAYVEKLGAIYFVGVGIYR
jgi:signal transduction histidine kinase